VAPNARAHSRCRGDHNAALLRPESAALPGTGVSRLAGYPTALVSKENECAALDGAILDVGRTQYGEGEVGGQSQDTVLDLEDGGISLELPHDEGHVRRIRVDGRAAKPQPPSVRPEVAHTTADYERLPVWRLHDCASRTPVRGQSPCAEQQRHRSENNDRTNAHRASIAQRGVAANDRLCTLSASGTRLQDCPSDTWCYRWSSIARTGAGA